ncbi:MAG: hypothetical protein ACM3PC_02695 [Deltaproteobacteria bacterium]
MKADAVVFAGESGSDCLQALSASAGAALGRVVAICGAAAEVAASRRACPEVVALPAEGGGLVAGWNRGLFLRERDVLLLDGRVRLAEGALAEMLEVLHASDRVASVVPLTTAVGWMRGCSGVPRSTPVAAAGGRCVLLRHLALNMISALDPALENPDDALEDWSMRAARMGLRHLRCNRARATVPDAPLARPPRAPLLLARHPFLPEAVEAAIAGSGPRAAEHCLVSMGGPVRVCTSLAEAVTPGNFQVLHLQAPVAGKGELLALLEGPCHLVLGAARAWPDPALLFAAAHSSQAVVAASSRERDALVSELALDPSRVQVAEGEQALAALYRGVVERPAEDSLLYRSQMIDFLRARLRQR